MTSLKLYLSYSAFLSSCNKHVLMFTSNVCKRADDVLVSLSMCRGAVLPPRGAVQQSDSV